MPSIRPVLTCGFATILLFGCGKVPEATDAAVPSATAEPRTHTSPAAKEALPPVTVSEASPSKPAEAIYRLDDDRPRHDDEALLKVGIRKYESRRLVLYTDIPDEQAVRLPPLVEAVYSEFVEYFGELPAERDGSDWQITGYLMRDADLFQSAGLVPSNLPAFDHGLNRKRQFWMRDQAVDYYREHLLLHEATHCFMTTLPAANGPIWYMEGMAEHFAAHRIDSDGSVMFRVMPQTPSESEGFDRIALIRKEVDAGRALSLDDVFALRDALYVAPIPYAWAWAACHFFDTHPACRERFRELGDTRLRSRFREEFDARFASDAPQLRLQWQHFIHSLCYGYEFERALLPIERGQRPLEADMSITLPADSGWQPTGVTLEEGKRYQFNAEGRFSLADEPKPWVSTASGITLDYANGKPLGRLLAAVLSDDLEAPHAITTFLEPIDVSERATIAAPISGTLYLRINDGWDRLSDNRGSVTVTIRPMRD